MPLRCKWYYHHRVCMHVCVCVCAAIAVIRIILTYIMDTPGRAGRACVGVFVRQPAVMCSARCLWNPLPLKTPFSARTYLKPICARIGMKRERERQPESWLWSACPHALHSSCEKCHHFGRYTPTPTPPRPAEMKRFTLA